MTHVTLESLIQPERLARLADVLARRTRNLTIFLEDLYDPHNAAACLRSSEAFGIQDIYVSEGTHRFEPSPRVVQGADKWLHIHRFPDTAGGLAALRAAGYRIYTSDLTATTPLSAIDISGRVALAFGNEHAGASRALVEGADGTFIIPMRGFTQSFNVSVAVALTLQETVRRREVLLGPEGDLTPEEREALREEWLRLALKRGDDIARALGR